jgi:cellobiose transport system permease protein
MSTTTTRVGQVSTSESQRALVQRVIARIALYAFLTALALFFLFPFYTMLVGAFLEPGAIFSFTPKLYPADPTIANFTSLFQEMPFFRNIANSFLVAAGQTVGVLFFCALTGYTFAKRRFPGKNALFVFLLVTMMMPYQSTLIPWYLLMARLGWLDTYWPLWAPWWAPAFGIFLMRQYMVTSVPDELIDAAIIDGCTQFGVFWRVALPISASGLVVLGLLNFINAWNDFLYSLLVFTDETMRTAPLALALLLGGTTASPRYTLLFAGSVLATLPLLLIFFLFQRWLMEGILSGAIKG